MGSQMCEEVKVPLATLKGIKFGLLSTAEAEKLSVASIESSNEVIDPRLGMPNPTSHCTTCGAKDFLGCEGHFGVIKFPFTILHPYFLSETVSILNKICPGCKSIRRDRCKDSSARTNCKYCSGSKRDQYPKMKFRVSTTDVFQKTAVIVEVVETPASKSRSGSSGLVLAPDYWDIIPKDEQQDESTMQPNKRVISHAQVYHILKDVDPKLLEETLVKKNYIFLDCLLLTPNSHRVSEIGQHVTFDDRTRVYKKLVGFGGTANELSSRVLDGLKTSKIYQEKSTSKDPAANPTGLRYIKELLHGKRTNHIMRMVVVGDPNIKLSEIGIPCNIAERVIVSETLSSLNWDALNASCTLQILDKGEVYIRRKDNLHKVSSMGKLEVGDAIQRPLKDGDIVMINRPPSIHQHSIIALTVKVLSSNSVLSINPLICSPFRGDFDGDCLHGYIPQSVNTRVELQELVGLDKQLTDAQSGRNLLSFGQDSLTAAHLVLEDGVTLNKYQMQQLQMLCPRELQNSEVKGENFFTGKQLFSLLLPPEFNYEFPSDGVFISGGELLSSPEGSSWLRETEGNLFHCLVKSCPDKVLGMLCSAQEVLCEWLTTRGLSVSLSDLYLSSDSESRENLIEEVAIGLAEAERTSHIKLLMVDASRDFLSGNKETLDGRDFSAERLCYEKQRLASLSIVSVAEFKYVFRDIQNLIYHYAEKDNSLVAMLKAGTKGNPLKLVQHSMCLGLQNSLVPIAYRLPRYLSCEAWNDHKAAASSDPGHYGSYIPCAVVESSYLTGLNPLECFVHSVTTRESSFSDNADLPGTLYRRLTFMMRDLCMMYDGTVRSAFGNQVIEFSYKSEDTKSAVGGHPVGSLAAGAISEAAYSALDQPITPLETSPLLNLKKALECGVKKSSGVKTASLFLSKKLLRLTYGFEYAALEIQSHLERLRFSDIVSSVMIFFSPQSGGRRKHSSSPWVCHFHIFKDMLKRRRIKVKSVVDALSLRSNSICAKSKTAFPELQITSKMCSEVEKEKSHTICITVTISEGSKDPVAQLDTLKEMVIPALLETVVKGFTEIKKVEILSKDSKNVTRYSKGYSGELYLRVHMSEYCVRDRFWSALLDNCLPIMDMIDWERSHPDDIHDITSAYGIDFARTCFLKNLKSAISDTGKSMREEHLSLATDCLCFTGEFVSLNAKGFSDQRKSSFVSSPFTQACFANPADCFIRAAKKGALDELHGSVSSLSWGKIPSIGTGAGFDIVFSGKEHVIEEPKSVYGMLTSSHVASHEETVNVKAPGEHNSQHGRRYTQHLIASADLLPKEFKSLKFFETMVKEKMTLNRVQKLSKALKTMLHMYPIDQCLSQLDKSIAMLALDYHPRRKEKIGNGIQEIKVVNHPEHENSRCFLLVRTDGTTEDFSYHKCINHAMEIVSPQKAKVYESRRLNGIRREPTNEPEV